MSPTTTAADDADPGGPGFDGETAAVAMPRGTVNAGARYGDAADGSADGSADDAPDDADDADDGGAARPSAEGDAPVEARVEVPAPPRIGPEDAETVDRLRLAGVPGLSPRLVARIVADLGSAGATLRATPARLAAVPGVGATRAGLLVAAPSRAEAERDLLRARSAGASVLFSGTAGWPAALGDLPDPPSVLFVRGDLAAGLRAEGAPAEIVAALRGRGVAIVGSRRASAYGIAQAKVLATALGRLGIPVVSGLARGIDTAAHRGALDAGGVTIGVLGGGMARFYPPENLPVAREMAAGRGAVVSEFPLDVPPLPHHFPRRNRLIAALSAAVVVVEAAEGSGSLITADHALDLGREVLAIPGRIDQPNSRGVHKLLREGAAICESAEDVLRALGIEIETESEAGSEGEGGSAATVRGADPAERAILAALAGDELDADAILSATGLAPSAGLGALTTLELRGALRLGGDGRYSVAT